MAFQSIWYFTDLPEEVVEIIEKDLANNFDHQMADSKLHGDALNKEKRNSQNAWIPTTHWLGGFMWHYVQRANRENFLYDLRCIDGESMQYTRYQEGQFYNWHNDAGLQTQYKPVSAGNRQDGLAQDFAPRKRGTIILFDSRTQHRVLKVKSGVRKSIVGWTVGPRWR
jgi:predicted 2-oxoglutarate/Fe(II)-dependent dioxygenase YbiX